MGDQTDSVHAYSLSENNTLKRTHTEREVLGQYGGYGHSIFPESKKTILGDLVAVYLVQLEIPSAIGHVFPVCHRSCPLYKD